MGKKWQLDGDELIEINQYFKLEDAPALLNRYQRDMECLINENNKQFKLIYDIQYDLRKLIKILKYEEYSNNDELIKDLTSELDRIYSDFVCRKIKIEEKE